MYRVWTVTCKELSDILRDSRALLTIATVTILAGPLILLFVANLLSDFEAKAERRLVLVSGISHSPSLRNYLERESAQIVPAPADFRAALANGQLSDPVLIIPPEFDTHLQQGKQQTLQLLTDSRNSRAQAGVARIKRWLQGYASQQSAWYLLQQGIAPSLGNQLQIDEINLASDRAETAKLFGMLPYFLVFAALYGVWGAALETSIGERDGRTLEVLLMTPISNLSLLLGKWLAVSITGMTLTTAAILCFIPAQQLIASDTLQAMFNFNLHTAIICLLCMCPLTALFAAGLIWLGFRARSMRQAQANATLLMLMTAFMPMLGNTSASTGVMQWLPVIAQHHLILDLLNGQPPALLSLGSLLLTCLLLSMLLVYDASRTLTYSTTA